jgi:hypothetical protein
MSRYHPNSPGSSLRQRQRAMRYRWSKKQVSHQEELDDQVVLHVLRTQGLDAAEKLREELRAEHGIRRRYQTEEDDRRESIRIEQSMTGRVEARFRLCIWRLHRLKETPGVIAKKLHLPVEKVLHLVRLGSPARM